MELTWERLRADKYRLAVTACLLLGAGLGSVTCVFYGGTQWHGILDAYCSGGKTALLAVAPVTVSFLAALFVVAPFAGTRLLIAPAVCLRAMGVGALICGVIQADGWRGLCFASLALLPYAVINACLTVKAGECALGLRASLRQEAANLRGGILLHTLGKMLLYLLSAAGSCGIFAASCVGFGKYLL